MRTLAGPGLLLCASSIAGLASLTACRINVDSEGFIDREQKRFAVEGVVDLSLYTFDGAVEVRGWDRPEVVVEIEKHGEDKEAVDKITVLAEQTGKKIQIDVRHPGSRTFVGIGSFTSPSARLIVNAPHKINLEVRTADGSIVIERLEGKLQLRTADGRIRATESGGDLLAESGDGALTLEDVIGRVEARTDDGGISVSGIPGAVRVRSGDGTITLRIRRGAIMTEDWMVATSDGSISAELPDDFSAMIEAEPGSDSRARSDLALADAVGGTREQRSLRGRLGAGGKTFVLRTGDGSIRLTQY
ncbi:MAG TPA: DUF4097 family beta strand repeat-containing protein [Vicinamibacterales bacterium]|nr:DUF4097 family beta strand repeat-containing protein [Vicinamibacterales bacterium]